MGFLVENAGILTTIQDEGRFGYQQYGVAPAGPMDVEAFYLANILVGNQKNEAALEVTFSGPTLLFDQDNIIAVTGGTLEASINGNLIPSYQAICVKKGDIFTMGITNGNGARAYIAFAGGLDIEPVMGSKATLMRNHIGGIDGRKLENGDKIDFLDAKTCLHNMACRKLTVPQYAKKEIVLRTVLGPQSKSFSREEIKKFFWYSVKITNDFDRMGCRLERHEPLHHINDGNIISDGIAFGSIQIPTNGQPIIMLADRQSTGGYTKIGTVISVDLPKIAQAMPGFKIRFQQVDIELAQDLYIKRKNRIDSIDNLFNKNCKKAE